MPPGPVKIGHKKDGRIDFMFLATLTRPLDPLLYPLHFEHFHFRLSELRDVLVELRSKQEQETQERRMLEQTQQMK